MPLVKLDYVVSFSSEDPEHKASNLLNSEIGKKYWLCGPGETSASVVLQLPRVIKISAVNVGVYHAALVEILVGRSECPNEPFQVLVPSCIVVSAGESKREEGVRRVRTFAKDALEATAASARWDRVRIVCTQPYNKHCKFGLVFVHVFEGDDYKHEDNSVLDTTDKKTDSEKPDPKTSPKINKLIMIPTADSSDEEDHKPGELFAQYLNTSRKENQSVRQATMQALKNNDDSTRLVRTSLNSDSTPSSSSDHKNKSFDTIVGPSTSTGNIPKDKKRSWAEFEPGNDKKKAYKAETSNKRQEETLRNRNSRANGEIVDDDNKKDIKNKVKYNDDSKEYTPTRKKLKKNNGGNDLQAGPVSDSPHEILKGVVFALSGYENPRRSDLRTAGLALGAKYERDYSDKCTHLICAFPNAPRLRAARDSGTPCIATRGEWLEQQAKLRRALPWQWFATEPQYKVTPLENYDAQLAHSEDSDTDDEIAAVLQIQRKRANKTDQERDPKRQKNSDDQKRHKYSENQINYSTQNKTDPKTQKVNNLENIDESTAINDTSNDTQTDDDTDRESDEENNGFLPAVFDGLRFRIAGDLKNVGLDPACIIRYVKAYGGLVIQDEDAEVDYVLCCEQSHGQGRPLRPDWIWRCHEKSSLAPTDAYLL